MRSLTSKPRWFALLARLLAAITTITVQSTTSPARADEAADVDRKPIREIFVPESALNVILESQPQRVYLTRREYEELLSRAQSPAKSPDAPLQTAVVRAQYSGRVEVGRARLLGTITIDVLADGLHAVPLRIGEATLRRAVLDGNPAPVARHNPTTLHVLVEGQGRHTLELEMLLPVSTSAAEQALLVDLPTAASMQLSLAVPGNVEVKDGAAVQERRYDSAAELTHFQLLPPRQAARIVMSLNNRLLQRDRVVVARSLAISEFTRGFERLHVTWSMEVLHGAVDEFRYAIPDDVEITKVTAPQLARWQVTGEDGQRQLHVLLREGVSETVVLRMEAERNSAALDAWTLPKITAQDVAGQTGMVALLVESQLETSDLSAEQLMRIDTMALTAAIDGQVRASSGEAPLVPVAAWYAPLADYSLAGRFRQVEGTFYVDSQIALTLTDASLDLSGIMRFYPTGDRLYEFDVLMPPDWQLNLPQTTAAPNQQAEVLAFDVEKFIEQNGQHRYRVTIPNGWPVDGTPFNFPIRAKHTPNGWLDDWTTLSQVFPAIQVPSARRHVGTISVLGDNDLVARPQAATGLLTLDVSDAQRHALAYRYLSTDFQLTLDIARTSPRFVLSAYTFFHLRPDHANVRYELEYDVSEARARELTFELPQSTPQEISITSANGVGVSGYRSEDLEDGRRQWTVELERPTTGRLRLLVEYELPYPSAASENATAAPATNDEVLTTDIALPIVRAQQSVFESGRVAVEVSTELEVQVQPTAMRRVDVGELAAAEYQLGRHVLATYGYAGTTTALQAQIALRQQHALAIAIVERAELVTLVDRGGQSCNVARFLLRTKAPLLEVRLPKQAELWTVLVDGRPARPQKDGQQLLIDVGNNGSRTETADTSLRDVQVVYSQPTASMGLWGSVDLAAPRLAVRHQVTSQPTLIPVADMKWELDVPHDYRLIDVQGSVAPQQALSHQSPVTRAWQAVNQVWSPAIQAAREASRRNAEMYADTNGLAAGDDGFKPYHQHAFEDVEESFSALKEGQNSLRDEEFLSDLPALANAEGDAGRMDANESPPSDTPLQEAEQAARSTEAQQSAQRDSSRQLRGWAIAGLRGLDIDVQPTGNSTLLYGLGGAPQLSASLVHENRMDRLAYGVAIFIAVVGFALTLSPLRKQFTYALSVLLISGLVPEVFALEASFGNIFYYAFIVGLLLVPYYLLVTVIRSAVFRIRQMVHNAQAGLTQATVSLWIALLSTAVVAVNTHAQESPLPTATVVEFSQHKPKVHVPDDAVIVPYDPAQGRDVEHDAKILVPLAEYERLRRHAQALAEPKLDPAPTDYAFSGARYETKLTGDSHLVVDGEIILQVFADHPIEVPLLLSRGVLAQATLNDKPAPIRLVQQQDAPNGQAAQSSQQRKMPAVDPSDEQLLMLRLPSKGTYHLQLLIQLKMARQGGWRNVTGRLPAAPATDLILHVPQVNTEVRAGPADAAITRHIDQADARIVTTLAAGGRITLRFRPQTTSGEVDRSLTVESKALVDVQENGVHVAWKLDLAFPQSRRQEFTLVVPEEYLVDGVSGTNVRGWSPSQSNPQHVQVTLLSEATNAESLLVKLTRWGRVGTPPLDVVEIPAVRVQDAALQRGVLVIRRSNPLELRAVATSGASRTDVGNADQLAVDLGVQNSSPLGMKPLAAFRFARPDFTLRFTASRQAQTTEATLQTLLKVERQLRTLECRIQLDGKGGRLFETELDLPAELRVDVVQIGVPHQWSLQDDGDRQRLVIYFAAGQASKVPVIISGQLGQREAAEQIDLPNITVSNAEQSGQLVVQADPGLRTTLENLQDCETIFLEQTHTWLQSTQRALSQQALKWEGTAYSATIAITPRQPQVEVRTVSNLRITDEAVEETVLLDFSIAEAGIREIIFRLPAYMQNARVHVPLLREKRVELMDPAIAGFNPFDTITPRQGGDVYARFTLTLQDDQMGQIRVLIVHDRPRDAGPHVASLPIVETARTLRQYATFENAATDEVVIDSQQGFVELTRQQQAYQYLTHLLGGRIRQAFVADANEAAPRLALSLRQRQKLQTVDARIGLAETLLVVDANGMYRARQIYHTSSGTEQYLVIHLPDGAALWTAIVAGEPVKPVQSATATDGEVRIPLVKTAAGDADYQVELVYAGQLDPLGRISTVEFPFIRTKNIHVERSQVELYLPEDYDWIDFDGTMKQVGAETDLLANFLAYKNKEIERVANAFTIQSGGKKADAYANLRALKNLKDIDLQQQQIVALSDSSNGETSEVLQKQIEMNRSTIAQAQQKLEQAQQQLNVAAEPDNRGKLNDWFEQQRNSYSSNVVNDIGVNFDQAEMIAAETSGLTQSSDESHDRWLRQNQLADNRQAGVSHDDVKKMPQQSATRQMQGQQQQRQQPTEQFGYGRGGRAGSGGGGYGGGKGGDGGAGYGGRAGGYAYDAPANQPGTDPFGAQSPAGFADQSAPGESPFEGRYEQQDHQQEALRRYAQQLEGGEVGQGGSQGGQMNETSISGGGLGGGGPLDSSTPLASKPMSQDGAGQQAAALGPVTGVTDSFDTGALAQAQPGRPSSSTATVGGASAAAPPTSPTGLSSLQLTLPQRGRKVLFTATRGQLVLSAKAVQQRSYSRLKNAGLLLLLAGGGYMLVCLASRKGWKLTTNRNVGLLIATAGLMMILFGVGYIGVIIILSGLLIWLGPPPSESNHHILRGAMSR